MPLENSSDRRNDIDAKSKEKETMDFIKRQFILGTSSDFLRESMDKGSSSQQHNNRKETGSTVLYSKTVSSDHLRPLDQVEQRQATLTEQHRFHDQADPRRQTSDHLRPRDQQTAPDNEEEKEILNLLTPEERQAFKSGDEKSKKKELAKQIYGSVQLMKTLRRTDSEIEEFVNFSVRSLREYKEHYGNAASSSQHQREINEGSLPQHQREINEGSSSQQHIEIIELSDSEEDAEKSPKQKQPSESRSHEREKWQSEPHEVHDQADPTRQADASSHSDHLGVGLDVVFGSVEFHDSKVEELNKEIEKCKVYHKEKNREIKEKREKIEKIYYKNENLKSEHIEKVVNDLILEYKESITNDLMSEYKENPINELKSVYNEKATNYLKSESGKNFITYLFSKHKENFINDLILEYKESITSKEPEEVKKIEGEFISKYNSKGFDTKSSEELIKSVREINKLQGSIQASQRLISYYEKQREKIPSGRNETSNQAEASSLADHLEASLDNLDLEFGDLEFREPHDQIQATSSQSFPEIRQPFAAHRATEAQRESTSQQADVRRQDQIEQRQDTIVQQHERYDQAGLRSEEEIKHHLRAFVDNLKNQGRNITKNRVEEMLNQNKIYTQKDLLLYHNCTVELSNEAPNQLLKIKYESISFYIGQRLTQRQ